jgi:hypothetical protein
MSRTISGNSKLALQYPKTWSQYGPKFAIPLQNNSNASSRGRGSTFFDICSLARKYHKETKASFASLEM